MSRAAPGRAAAARPSRARHRAACRRPRRVSTDARVIDLSGTWRFRWSPTVAAAPTGVEDPAFDDSAWGTIAVPSSFVMPVHDATVGGPHGAPAYTNVRYPFPVDPPHPPDANPVGDHRCRFVLDDPPRAGAPALRRHRGRRRHLAERRAARAPPAAAACRPTSRWVTCCWRARPTCSSSGSTSSAPRPTWRTRTAGGCRASSAR